MAVSRARARMRRTEVAKVSSTRPEKRVRSISSWPKACTVRMFAIDSST